MSEHPSFDRKKGFVALPVEILDIDLTPGAFRILVELCRMANAEGYCWPSLEQLSERSGRSKSAISGYLKELRNAELIRTEEQQTASGYNYRLKYRVTFWQDWRSSLTRRTTSKSERSVQQTERLKDSKNHIHKNQSKEQLDIGLDKALAQWARCFKGAPYPSAKSPPAWELLQTTDLYLSTNTKNTSPISAEISSRLSALWSELGLSSTGNDLASQREMLHSARFSQEETALILDHIRKNWPKHWHQFPTIQQFEKLVKNAGVAARSRKITLLKGYVKRWALAEKHLRNDTPSCSVNGQFIPTEPGMGAQNIRGYN